MVPLYKWRSKNIHICVGVGEGQGVWVGINQVVQSEVCITYLQTSAKHTKLWFKCFLNSYISFWIVKKEMSY